jgi:hypothetical protein
VGATWKVAMAQTYTNTTTDEEGNVSTETGEVHADMLYRLIECTPGERLVFTHEETSNSGGACGARRAAASRPRPCFLMGMLGDGMHWQWVY